jgi:ABC-2 type transport system permease protein
MTRPNPLWELTLARIHSFLREPEALFWVFGFPILMAVGLGIAFREGDQAQPAVVAVERGSAAERWVPALAAAPELAVRVTSADSADRMLRRGDAALSLGGTDTLVFRYDPARAESRAARLLADAAVQGAAGVTPAVPVRETPERRRGGRYIDWVIPGLIGMNLMSTGLWGIGFGLVQMRQRKQLKRLSSTPMRRRDFLLAQVLARMVFVVVEVPPIVLFAWLAFGVEIAGSALALAGVVALGGMTFAGLGLLTSSRASTIEGISGLLNVVMLPMFVLSGVFFSASRFPDAIQPFIRALPLTALNNALRAVYNDAAAVSAYTGELAILAAWTVGSFLLALWLFKWQ